MIVVQDAMGRDTYAVSDGCWHLHERVINGQRIPIIPEEMRRYVHRRDSMESQVRAAFEERREAIAARIRGEAVGITLDSLRRLHTEIHEESWQGNCERLAEGSWRQIPQFIPIEDRTVFSPTQRIGDREAARSEVRRRASSLARDMEVCRELATIAERWAQVSSGAPPAREPITQAKIDRVFGLNDPYEEKWSDPRQASGDCRRKAFDDLQRAIEKSKRHL